jgi:hypothetical protein
MRLDMMREEQTRRRKGLALKTILAVIWLAICYTVAYILTGWLEESGYLTPDFFYNQLFIPRTIDETIVRIGFMTVIVLIMQIFVLVGYAFSSPAGRLRTGTPTAEARDPDPTANKYDYH